MDPTPFRENARILLRIAKHHGLHPARAALMVAHAMHCGKLVSWPEARTVAWTLQMLQKAGKVWATPLARARRGMETALDKGEPCPADKLGLDRPTLFAILVDAEGTVANVKDIERALRYNTLPEHVAVCEAPAIHKIPTVGKDGGDSGSTSEWGLDWALFCRKTPLEAWAKLAAWARISATIQ